MKNEAHILVLYDGIENSVFAGQVLAPFIADTGSNKLLISFERKQFNAEQLDTIIPSSTGIQIHILKQMPFLGAITIWLAALQLKKILALYASYSLKARGPFAGLICAQALDEKKCQSLLIQARGLGAEEYSYAHRSAHGLRWLFHWIRYWQFEALERACYGTLMRTKQRIPITIEAVSPALRDYLFGKYGTPLELITVAEFDKPAAIDAGKRLAMRTHMRDTLDMPDNARVFCYVGSAKPWQCPEETIEYYKKHASENNEPFLLILTQDVGSFEKLAVKHDLPKSQYRIMKVPHDQVENYLCACDVGILLRDVHIVNWISRPTKALEYEAAGLEIIHNNTVHYLVGGESHMI